MDSMKQMVRRWRSEDGAQLVEYALVLPMLLLVVLGIAEFGVIFQRYEVLTNAAREGARIAVLPGYGNTEVVTQRVRAYATAGRVPNAATEVNVTVENVAVAVGGGFPALNCRRVTVTYNYDYLFLPGIGALFGQSYATVPLVAVSEMRSEIVSGT